MCGIVGYLGPKNPKTVILTGLKALEYRGYDSAGVSILHEGRFKRVRAEGKLSQLEERLVHEEFNGHLGIGHTRWATHGPPVERNAHPHCVGDISIVHNGIIENYLDLKKELLTAGAIFESETDSELIAHLIELETQKGAGLKDSVLRVLPRLHGAFSVLAVSKAEPDTMVAFKNGPPLIVGVGSDEFIVASDIQAIVPYTKKVLYLGDDEIASIEGGRMLVLNQQGHELPRQLIEVKWSTELVEKQGYRHFMLKEIFEQPRAVAAAIDPHIDLQNHVVQLRRVGLAGTSPDLLDELDEAQDYKSTVEILKGVERVFVVACGTSFYAAMVGEYYLERIAGIPVECDIASEFRYRHPVVPKNSLVIFISQSGETADTLAALRNVKAQGARTLSICNVRLSTIDREADGHLYMNAGIEVGVASTKALVCTMALLQLLALQMAKAKGYLPEDEEQKLVRSLLAAPSHMENVLAHDKFFSQAAETLSQYKGFLYMGRGASYPIALEGALKLKELAYMHAEGYAAGEMKHGPLALIDSTMAVVMLCPQNELYEKTVSNLEEAKARGGQIISIGTEADERLQSLSLNYLPLPEVNWLVSPLLEVIPLQLLAYHVADTLGHDVDQPRNLAKSVTVE